MNAHTKAILDQLDAHYGREYICYLNHENAWQLLIATMLSAQCTDARVNIVTKDLFVKYPSVEAFAEADLKELEQDIRPTGFYHNKAKNIIACCQRLMALHGGEVPSGLEELTALGIVATGERADPVGVAARVAFSQSPRPHEVYVAFMGDIVDKESEDPALQTVSAVLENALAVNGWYCICPVGLADEKVKEIIQWTETQNKLCGYIDKDPDKPIVDAGLYLRSFPFFPKETADQLENDIPAENLYGMAVAAAVKAMNYHAGQETWALMPLATVSPAKLTSTFIKKLEAANFNYVITVASKNITQGGKTGGGEWIDVIRFRDWLQNDMQVRVVNLLIVNPKIPYTDNGIGLVENQMLASLKDGQKYGGIAPTEYDADGNAIPGYTTSVPLAADLTSVQKASRILKDCKFSARIAGAIHVVEIKGCLTYENL